VLKAQRAHSAYGNVPSWLVTVTAFERRFVEAHSLRVAIIRSQVVDEY
jgi:hypothetical protein